MRRDRVNLVSMEFVNSLQNVHTKCRNQNGHLAWIMPFKVQHSCKTLHNDDNDETGQRHAYLITVFAGCMCLTMSLH